MVAMDRNESTYGKTMVANQIQCIPTSHVHHLTELSQLLDGAILPRFFGVVNPWPRYDFSRYGKLSP